MQSPQKNKPTLRGHFHQAAFFVAVGACAMLIARSHDHITRLSSLVYSVCLLTLFGTSALYHRPNWSEGSRHWMRRFDHAAIFIMIAGSFTPICLISLQYVGGNRLLGLVWLGAGLGILQSLFWVNAPKWLVSIFYIGLGWLAAPYLPEMYKILGFTNVAFLLLGGIVYTLAALVYVTKWPNPWPRILGYHEVFHILTIIAAVFHFILIEIIVTMP